MDISLKQKQIGIILILGIALLIGVFAMQSKFSLFNRASGPSNGMCTLPELKCTLKNIQASGDFEISMNIQYKDGTSTSKNVTFPKGFTPPATVTFTPISTVDYFNCFAKYINTDKEAMCVGTQAYSPSQCSPTTTPAACECKPGMECDPGKGAKREELYVGKVGPGLIILNPKITDNGACYECKKIKVYDTKQKRYIEEYDCPTQPNSLLFPEPTGIRLHQANGEQCREYLIEQWAAKIGEAQPTPTPIKCATCNEKICCPACKPPVEIGDGCQPFADYAGKIQQCDFTLGSTKQCIAINKQVEMVIKNKIAGLQYEVNWDDVNDAPNNTLPVPPESNLVHTYVDAGVYDIILRCPYNAGTVPEMKECKKRYSASCNDIPETPPVTTVTTTQTPTPTPTTTKECPWNPNDLNVQIDCPTCSLTGTPGVGTGTPGVGTGTPGVGTGTPGIGTGTPGIGTGTPGVGIGTGTPGVGIGTGTPGIGSPTTGQSTSITHSSTQSTATPTTTLPRTGTLEVSLLLVAIGVLVVAVGFVL